MREVTERPIQLPRNPTEGFTLIELSVVLVIIGLIVGGVLVGQDLIRAAYIRAQISQIEKFNTAVNTFYGKYQALPGDMNNSTASAFGFSMATHNGNTTMYIGQGNGDGILLDGMLNHVLLNCGNFGSGCLGATPTAYGETGVFWVDLSSQTAGNLIEGGFVTATEGTPVGPTLAQMPLYLPTAKLGNGNSVYITSIGGTNYYGIAISKQGGFDYPANTPGLTVAQAYNIDKKVDDGIPTTGNVAAMLNTVQSLYWAPGSSETYVPSGSLLSGVVATAGNPADSTTCFDAPTVGGTTNYSMEINGGAGLNCALIWKMQGGD
jgi:prepilin-type N-terminal cleavage/methylation domain-containing protein